MNSFNIEIFAKRLKELREAKKKNNAQFTQGYVAKFIGVARTTYTSYESGAKQPPLENVYALAKLFDCTIDYLLGRSNDPAKTEQDYIKSLIHPDTMKDIGETYDLEKLLGSLKDKQLTWGGQLLEGEARRRAVEVLKVLFNEKKDTN